MFRSSSRVMGFFLSLLLSLKLLPVPFSIFPYLILFVPFFYSQAPSSRAAPDRKRPRRLRRPLLVAARAQPRGQRGGGSPHLHCRVLPPALQRVAPAQARTDRAAMPAGGPGVGGDARVQGGGALGGGLQPAVAAVAAAGGARGRLSKRRAGQSAVGA